MTLSNRRLRSAALSASSLSVGGASEAPFDGGASAVIALSLLSEANVAAPAVAVPLSAISSSFWFHFNDPHAGSWTEIDIFESQGSNATQASWHNASMLCSPTMKRAGDMMSPCTTPRSIRN